MVLRFLDIFFFAFHLGLIFFNLFGWIWKRTRKWNLITLSVTAFSWLGLGIFYGIGYCFLTDWHYAIRQEMGYVITSNSYIHYLISNLLNVNLDETMVDFFTAFFFLVAIMISIYFNLMDFRRKRKLKP
ncbi:MAG: DUF2784 domain-containing protein [Flammeovirgaceae bacterium]|nr:DUF2784 domain-containing protein [Flammeovirgaceae bacterium]